MTACQRGHGVPAAAERKPAESIPMEYVDAETGGEKGGGTHFSISSDALFLNYTNYDDVATATAELDEETRNPKQVIERGPMHDSAGAGVGKYIITEEHTDYENDRFCLKWTKVNRYTSVCSASRRALEEFRATYDL